MTLTIPRDGYIEMMQREGIVLVPYADGKKADGTPIHTQGIGTQWNYDKGRPVQEDDPPITIEDAIRWKKLAIAERLEIIERKLKVEVTPHQLYAILSIFYQFGTVALDRITSLFNEGRPWAAILAFAEFPFGQDRKQTEGHSKRRIGEMCIAAFGYYDEQSQVPLFRTDPRSPDTVKEWIDVSTLEL